MDFKHSSAIVKYCEMFSSSIMKGMRLYRVLTGGVRFKVLSKDFPLSGMEVFLGERFFSPLQEFLYFPVRVVFKQFGIVMSLKNHKLIKIVNKPSCPVASVVRP